MEMTLTQIANRVDGKIIGDGKKTVHGVSAFDQATPNDITLAGLPKYLKKIDETNAGAVIVPDDFEGSSKILVRVKNPQVAFAEIIAIFHPRLKRAPGISANADIGEKFICGKKSTISPFVAIGHNVTVGDRTLIFPNVVIGDHVVIGDDVILYPNVTILERCRIGNRVIIHAGTVIGSDGFGFAPDGENYVKIPQTGIVQIDADVEIGAGNTIDRATFGKTWIQKGVKTDNQVHLAHNVTVGENSILVAQVGISGSVSVGEHVVLAGQAGVAGHLKIGDHAIIGPQAGIAKSVPSGEVVSGSPEIPHRLWLKVQRIIPRLPELKKKLGEIEKRLIKIEEKLR